MTPAENDAWSAEVEELSSRLNRLLDRLKGGPEQQGGPATGTDTKVQAELLEKAQSLSEVIETWKQAPQEDDARLTTENSPEAPQNAPEVAEFPDEPPFSGEAKLIISAPVKIGTVLRLYDYLQTLPDIKLVYTSGARDTDVAITIAVDKPTPIVSLITRVGGVALVTGTAAGGASEEKMKPLIEKKRSHTREIRLVCRD